MRSPWKGGVTNGFCSNRIVVHHHTEKGEENMKGTARIVSLLALVVMVAAPLAAQAIEKQPQIKNEVVMKVGRRSTFFTAARPT